MLTYCFHIENFWFVKVGHSFENPPQTLKSDIFIVLSLRAFTHTMQNTVALLCNSRVSNIILSCTNWIQIIISPCQLKDKGSQHQFSEVFL